VTYYTIARNIVKYHIDFELSFIPAIINGRMWNGGNETSSGLR